MKKMIFQGKICYFKGRKYEWEKIKFTLWDYYSYSDGLTKYFGKKIDYDYWWQVYSDYIFARQYLEKFNLYSNYKEENDENGRF